MWLWYMCMYMHACSSVCRCMYAFMWRPKVEVWGLSPSLLILFFVTGSLAEPGAHHSQQVSSQLAPGTPASTFRGWSCRLVTMSTWHFHGVQAFELPSSCLHVRTSAAKPSSHPCTFYLRENLPTQFTKPENQEPSPAVHSRGRF